MVGIKNREYQPLFWRKYYVTLRIFQTNQNVGRRQYFVFQTPGILQFCKDVGFDRYLFLLYKKEHKLLPSSMAYICGEIMTIVKKNDISDGEVWRCKCCYSKKSIRSNTICRQDKLCIIYQYFL